MSTGRHNGRLPRTRRNRCSLDIQWECAAPVNLIVRHLRRQNLKAIASSCLGLLILCGCSLQERGFRFHGEYRAPRSRFQIALLSQGFVKPGNDVAESAFSIVQFCPAPGMIAKPFQVSMMSPPDQWIKVESEDVSFPVTEWNWKTSGAILNNLLNRAGYSDLAQEEVKDIGRAMESSLLGPKGFILKGQGKSIGVQRADIEYGFMVQRNKPQDKWVESRELPQCGLR